MTQSAHEDQFITAEQATGCSVAANSTRERTGHTAAEQAAYWRGFEEAQLNAQHNAKVRADALRDAVMDAIAEALGDAYDCTRVWSAWSVGTMGQDDFSLITDDADRLGDLADAAIAAMVSAGSPASTQPIERDWELSCDHCNGDGFVYVVHQVAERKTDVQEFKEECESCEGCGFTIAFEDIPGIAEYVKSRRPASTVADEGAKDERQAFEAWLDHRGVWPALCYEEVFIAGWNARPVAAPAAGDALVARQLLPKLQSLLDRMANDPRTGTMFEADGDTLRDAMHLCRSVVVDAASQQGGEKC